jgi:adenosylmethionine-8-amino-7-oxononanoate aminotransferase
MTYDGDALRAQAQESLWLHFARLGEYTRGKQLPIITEGEGCHLEDADGNRYLDALAGLFAVQIGYSHGEEMGEAAAAQLRELPFHTNWSLAHPRSIELAAELRELTPEGFGRAFFVNGGSEAVETAWKFSREYFRLRGEHRYKAIARDIAYHGTTMGALSINGLAGLRSSFEPLVPSVAHVTNTSRYRRPPEETEAEFTKFLVDELAATIEREGPDTVAMVIMEPVQNSGGAYTPPEGYFAGVREVCDHYGVLLCADEVICGFGRVGAWFGSERYDIRPDLMTCAKGLSSAHGAIGALLVSDAVAEPFLNSEVMFTHGITFGGHPVQAALALKNIEIMKREGLIERVREKEAAFGAALEPLRELNIVGDLRGVGYYWALELVKDSDTREAFSAEESERILRGFISPRLLEAGLICRADDSGEPAVQLSPPLVADESTFAEIARILGEVLPEAEALLS